MRRLLGFLQNQRASAAAELALSLPVMLALMFGSLELGNLFLEEHALSKQVRDGARFGARMELASDYDCTNDPATVFAAGAGAADEIRNVTKNGVVSGAGSPRWPAAYWARTCEGDQAIAVTMRCVPKGDIDTDDSGNTGIYTSLDGDIPVVVVEARVQYRSLLSAIGFDATNICLNAKSEAAVSGI